MLVCWPLAKSDMYSLIIKLCLFTHDLKIVFGLLSRNLFTFPWINLLCLIKSNVCRMQNYFWISGKSADIHQVLQIAVSITWHNCHQTQPPLLIPYQLLLAAGRAWDARPAGRCSSRLVSGNAQAFWRSLMPRCQIGDKDVLSCQEDRVASQEPANM